MTKPQRVRGGAAAEERLKEALDSIDDLFSEIDREIIRNPLLARDCVVDGHAVVRETLEFVTKELNLILKRRDQAVDDMRDLVARIEELETWRAQQERSARPESLVIPARRESSGGR